MPPPNSAGSCEDDDVAFVDASFTLMLKLQYTVLPAGSSILYDSGVIPTGNTVINGCCAGAMMSTMPELSFAVGALHCVVVPADDSVNAVMSCEHVSTVGGKKSCTVMVVVPEEKKFSITKWRS